MIQEDLSVFNAKIVDISTLGENRLKIKRIGEEDEFIQIPNSIPSYSENDSTSINYVVNRPVEHNTLSENAKKMDIAILDNGEMYVYTGSDWMLVQKANRELFGTVRIPEYIEDKVYEAGNVVMESGHIFRANRGTHSSPRNFNPDWTMVTEYDMFVSICEVSAPRLVGYFDVSGALWEPKTAELIDKPTFLEWFSDAADRGGYDDLIDYAGGGFGLNAKDNNVTSMTYVAPIDTQYINITSIKIEGRQKTIDSIGKIELAGSNDNFMLYVDDKSSTREDSLCREYYKKTNGEKYDRYFTAVGDNGEFELLADLSRVEPADSMSLVFSYNNDYNLSKHIIDKITIEYERRID
jgi:hypothetical protein